LRPVACRWLGQIDGRDKGVYYQQIIQDHGIPESQLWQATKQLSREGKTSRKLTSPETLAFEAAVRAYRAQGMTGDEIAQKTGKHRTSVYAALRRLDIPLSKRTGDKTEASHRLKTH
jgi:transposase-like protein